MSKYNFTTLSIISLIGLVLLLPGLGWVHLFDWDEINFAEAAREMLVTGDWAMVTINYEPFWEKPPLFIWMQALSMKLFGVNEFAARLPSAIAGVVTLNFIYYIGLKYFRPSIAQWWVFAYLAALFPHFYFKTGLIDPTFNLFIFISIHQLAKAYAQHQKRINNSKSFLIASFFIGLAVLTKGPAALLIFILVLIILCLYNRAIIFTIGQLLISALCTFLVVSIWFVPETLKNGFWFIQEFINYQIGLASQNIAGHAQPWYYHPLVLFFGCAPVSLLAIKGMHIKVSRHIEKPYYQAYHILFWVVLIVFSIVKTKIIHYSSLCWIPLTFLAAYAIDYLLYEKNHLKKLWKLFWFVSIIPILFLSISFSYLSVTDSFDLLTSFIKDDFLLGMLSVTTHVVNWKMFALVIAAFLFLITFIGTIKNINKLKYFFLVSIINISLLSWFVVPMVDAKMQKPLFDFYKSLQGKDVYVETIHFKSYAHYFYTKIKPLGEETEYKKLQKSFLNGQTLRGLNNDSLLMWQNLRRDFFTADPRDKDVYVIYKLGRKDYPTAKRGFFDLGKYGAYRVFLRRKR